ncbi:MAG: right-handed parallel beta-helix repeat-containing protein, partial [Bacteroidia bacterium]
MKFIYLFIFVISFTNVHAQLAGTYTIDPNKSADSVNYLSIEAAIGDLNDGLRSDSATANGPGVSDTVIFLIAEGTYKTQLVLNPVTGASDTSRIFFQSASADSSKVIITYPSASSQSGNYVLKLNSASYITFSGISFQRTGSDYYATIVYVSRGRNNTFTNCHFKGSLTSKSGPDASAIYVDGDDLRNTFKNLYIDSAEYGIFYYAGSSPGSRNRIENCIIKNITKAGISLINQDSVLVKNNIISAIKDEFGSGIMMHKCFNPQLIGNKITLQNGGRGIDDYETKRKSTARGLIANNMISVTGGRWAYGMYFYQSEYMDLYNNSVYIGDKTGQQRIGLFVQDASTASRHYKVFNNIFANYSGDVGIFISQYSHSNFDSLGHNNYFSSGYYFGAIERSFTTTTYNAFTGTSNWNSQLNERNSLSTDPLYFAVDDLHTENILLNGKGKVRQIIKTDFDGELRDPLTPDIGADEYASFFTDISLLKIEKPIPGKCEDTSDLKVKLINNGSDTLRNIKLTWKINGIVQDTFSKAVSMATGSEVTYTIGRIAWPVNVYDTVQISVLDTADKNQRNNTISSAYRKGIKGDFTLGTDSSDYKTFEHALQDLYTFGVCGDVNFNLADGIYNKRLEIFPIPGAGKNSRITFRSASKDSTKVILTKPSETGNLDSNYVLSFNGADYICFENISIIRSGSNYIGQAVLFRNKAQFNILRNCVVAASKRSSVYSWIISDHGNSNDSNLIENNILKFGIGPVLFGNVPVNSNSKSYGNTFKNNIFDSSLATGLKFYNQEKIQLFGNTYVPKLSGFDTAFYLKYCNNSVNISGNYINLKRGGQAIILDE